jgi:hypothetical protein
VTTLPNGVAERPKATTVNGNGRNPKNAVPFMGLTSRNCHWPVRDNARGVADLFCGDPAAFEGCPYCSEHYNRSRQAGTVR